MMTLQRGDPNGTPVGPSQCREIGPELRWALDHRLEDLRVGDIGSAGWMGLDPLGRCVVLAKATA